MSDTQPYRPKSFVQETVQQTSTQWAANGSYLLETYQMGYETDTGKAKMGDGVSTYAELEYWNPQGQTWQNTAGTPTPTDLIGFTDVTAAVTATAEWTCDDVGTAGATIIVGNKLYTVVASGATGDQIDDGASATAFADNIATKVTTDTADTLCTAENVGAVITFTANTTGAAGNDIPLSTTDVNITADVFENGADAVYTPKATTISNLVSNIITGTIDCSTNPNYPAATQGAIYIVSVAGKIGGASGVTVEVGDWAVAIATNAGGTQASVGSSWDIVQTNITRPTSGYTTTATAAGTTTLVEASTYQQFFTGATTQTVVLPVVTTLQLGWSVLIVNNSSGTVTVNSSGANLVQTIPAGGRALITCILLTGTSAASWASTLIPANLEAGNQTSNIGYLNIPQNSQSAAYELVLSDSGKHILHPTADNNPRTFTIPANGSVAFPIGTAITFINQINTLTIAITTDTLTWAEDNTTGSRAIAAGGMATIIKVASTQWVISGVQVT